MEEWERMREALLWRDGEMDKESGGSRGMGFQSRWERLKW